VKWTLIFLSAVGVCLAQEAADLKFTQLDDFVQPGEWEIVKNVTASAQDKAWSSVEEGTGLLINGKKGKAGDLITKAQHGDVELTVQFMIPRGSNSGIYLQERYEVQILDSFGKTKEQIGVHDCGAIYERWDEKRDPKGFEGQKPEANASKPPGEWQTFHIIFRAPRFDAAGKKTENARFVKVMHNGVLIHENVAVTGPTRGGKEPETALGPLRIQGDHGPVAIRQLKITPLTL